MDCQRNLILSWANNLYQEKNMEDLFRQQSLLLTMELEDTRLRAQEELKMRDEQISQLKNMFNTAMKERDEAQENCQKLFLEKLLLQQQLQNHHQTSPHSGISSIEDEPRRGIDSNNNLSSSDCEESIVSSPPQLPPPAPPAAPPPEDQELPVPINRPLPEKGKLLQAVIKAGPLLQTLLLAGPLPQWRHPPPPLDTYQIPPPPVVIQAPAPPLPIHQELQGIFANNCGAAMNRKRGLPDGSDDSCGVDLKYQRVLLQ